MPVTKLSAKGEGGGANFTQATPKKINHRAVVLSRYTLQWDSIRKTINEIFKDGGGLAFFFFFSSKMVWKKKIVFTSNTVSSKGFISSELIPFDGHLIINQCAVQCCGSGSWFPTLKTGIRIQPKFKRNILIFPLK